MKLLGNLVAYQLIPTQPKNTLIITNDQPYKKIVTHTAESVTDVKPGDEIITSHSYTHEIEYNQICYHIIHADQINAIVEPSI